MDHQFFMQEALKEAQKAYALDEVPVGAVLVYDGEIIARAFNRVESDSNATRHAEMQCIEMASKILNNFRLLDCVLYTTLEPCLMCAGACVLSRIKTIVYAAPDLRHGAFVSQYELFKEPHPIHTPVLIKGPFEEESKALLKEFFRAKRESKECVNLNND